MRKVMTKVKRNSKQICRKELALSKTTATKVIKFNAVAGLHSSVLSYAELIDYGKAATI